MIDQQSPQIITVTLNPAVDSTLYFNDFHVGGLNRVLRETVDPGGKGVNVAKVVRALGLPVTATGFLGRGNAALFQDFFRQVDIHDSFIQIAGSTRTNLKLVDEPTGQVSEVNFAGLPYSETDLYQLSNTLRSLVYPGCWVVCSGSLPPNAPTDLYACLIGELRQKGGKVFLDTSGKALAEGIRAKPDAIKPNLHELGELTGCHLQNDSEVLAAMEELLNAGIGLVVVSMGAKGALAATREQRWKVTPPPIAVKSTVGAGDTLVAGLLVGLVKDLTLADSMRLATAAAAAAVALPGTRAASQVEMEKLCKQVVVEKINFDIK
ncbi:MAG TPA: 1-phosphofructokinase [Bacillota bacterium]|nr:1-phosphofructokinase [Bacillota bacterium]